MSMIEPKKIQYIDGDVRSPVGDGNKIICHCCNDIGKMGAGVALAIAQKWPQVKQDYIKWHGTKSFKLGAVQFVSVEDNLRVCNIIGQHDIGKSGTDGKPPVRYSALSKALVRVWDVASLHPISSVHCPYLMGCVRAGGKWEIIEELLEGHLASQGIEVYVYKYDKG